MFLWDRPNIKEKRGGVRYGDRIVTRRGSMQRSASLTLLPFENYIYIYMGKVQILGVYIALFFFDVATSPKHLTRYKEDEVRVWHR